MNERDPSRYPLSQFLLANGAGITPRAMAFRTNKVAFFTNLGSANVSDFSAAITLALWHCSFLLFGLRSDDKSFLRGANLFTA
jgi:hypothetical protein